MYELNTTICLIGMPGSGKSSLGNQLAAQFKLNFIDLDLLIEQVCHTTITKLWEMKGEPQFRIMERFCLLQALTQGYHILSSGGGTPCFFDNMSLINKYCFSIYLKSTKPLLTREMQEGMHPVFKNGPVVEKWNDLLQKRSIYYERAHLIQNAYASEPNVLEAVSSFCLKENIIKVKL